MRYKNEWIGLSLLLALGILLLTFGVGAAQTKTPATPPAKAPEVAKIDVNKATADQLTKCGISQGLAKAIIDHREKSGPFKNPEDLLKVKGMTKELYNKLSPKADKGVLYISPVSEDEDEPGLKPSKC